MKKTYFILLLLVMSIIESYPQQNNDVKLTNKDGKYKIEYNGTEYNANKDILTIKPKDMAYLKRDIEVVRENKLGYVDIRIPSNKNISAYANELKETELFDVIEFNSFGEYQSWKPNDTQIDNQWYLSTIHMDDAWEISKGCSTIVVGILDSGIDWEHVDIGIGPDSYQNIYMNNGEDIWSDINNPLPLVCNEG